MEYRDLLQAKTITKITQLQNFDRSQPASVFQGYHELTGSHIYYRRGDTPAFSGNFIPVWLYPLLFEKVIMFIPPVTSEADIINYCGAPLDAIARLANEGFLVPLVANNLDSYSEVVFRPFFENLDKPAIRGHLYEDARLGGDFAFENQVAERAKRYQQIMGTYTPEHWEQYNKEREMNPLVPAPERLARFIGERAEWQLLGKQVSGLDGEKNIQELERALAASPLEAYSKGHNLHYLVVPDFYSRGGFVALAQGEDKAVSAEIQAALPNEAKEFSLKWKEVKPGPKVPVKPTIELIISLRRAGAQKPLIAAITGLRQLTQFHKAPVAKYEEFSTELGKIVEMYNQCLTKEIGKRKYRFWRRVLAEERYENVAPYVQASAQFVGAALSNVSVNTLARAIEPYVGQPVDPRLTAIIAEVFERFLKQPLESTGQEIVTQVLERIVRTLNELLPLKYSLPPGEWKTPFVVVGYPNPMVVPG